MDLVALPYHGTVEEPITTRFAAAKLRVARLTFSPMLPPMPCRGRRYTLAMCRVRAKQTMDHVVRTPPCPFGHAGYSD